MNEPIASPMPEDVPLTEAASETLTEYNVRVATSSNAALKISLVILVWGPNPDADHPVARKRKQIRDELRRRGHAAVFSEDLPIHNSSLSLKSIEYDQAVNADLIVILMESPGSIAEAHDFCNHERIAPNIYVMIPEEYKDGYSGRGALRDLEDGYHGIHWYKHSEIENCNVLTKVLRCSEARRRMRFRNKGTNQ